MTVRGGMSWAFETESRFRKGDGSEMNGNVAVVAMLEEQRDVLIPGGLESGANRVAAALEEWAKVNHPWQNKTGLAEASLTGFVVDVDGGFDAGLAHGVDYGFYLERDPRWSVLDKAQQAIAPMGARLVADEVSLELRGRGSKFRHRSSGRFA